MCNLHGHCACVPILQGRHFMLICGGGSGAVPSAGVQVAESLGGGQGAKPPEAPVFLTF